MANERQARLGDRIKVILAERLEKGLRDPRLGFVTITDVRVTGDLQHASVFYTVLGTPEERAASGEALKGGVLTFVAAWAKAAKQQRNSPKRSLANGFNSGVSFVFEDQHDTSRNGWMASGSRQASSASSSPMGAAGWESILRTNGGMVSKAWCTAPL